jgi:hypothetical protein
MQQVFYFFFISYSFNHFFIYGFYSAHYARTGGLSVEILRKCHGQKRSVLNCGVQFQSSSLPWLDGSATIKNQQAISRIRMIALDLPMVVQW